MRGVDEREAIDRAHRPRVGRGAVRGRRRRRADQLLERLARIEAGERTRAAAATHGQPAAHRRIELDHEPVVTQRDARRLAAAGIAHADADQNRARRTGGQPLHERAPGGHGRTSRRNGTQRAALPARRAGSGNRKEKQAFIRNSS